MAKSQALARIGRERFMKYMTGLLDSHQPAKVFREVYGVNFGAFLDDFKQHVNERTQNAT